LIIIGRKRTFQNDDRSLSFSFIFSLKIRLFSVNITESENEQRKFLKLNKQKRRSIHELQFNRTVFSEHKRAK